MILGAVRDGRLDVEWVLDLSIPQLNALVLTIVRLKYRDKEEDAWTNLVASQMWKDPKKAMEKHTKPWRRLLRRSGTKQKGPGIKEFAQRFRGGV